MTRPDFASHTVLSSLFLRVYSMKTLFQASNFKLLLCEEP